ncbi:MAG: relaxase/mobilization nuclease domain-containing protein, partial [Phormidium sp.]
MIGKQIKGKGFRGCLDYVLGKKGAYIIGGTMCGQTAEALSTEFAITRQLKPHLKMAVFHATLSVDSREKLDSDVENERRWCSVANDYMKAMEFDNSQYVVVKHTDTQHDHIHIVGSRIRFDGTVVDDSWDYYKSQDVIRALEAKYNLEVLAPSWESEKRAQTTGEYRKTRDTGQKSVRVQLQALIEQCTHDNPTMPELIEQLQQEDVEVQIRMTRTGCIKGISYQLNGIAFNGTQLGKTYTFHGLQKYRGISYDSEDNELLKMLTQQQAQAIITDSTEGLTDKSLP